MKYDTKHWCRTTELRISAGQRKGTTPNADKMGYGKAGYKNYIFLQTSFMDGPLH